jgi:hypothetical protein
VLVVAVLPSCLAGSLRSVVGTALRFGLFVLFSRLFEDDRQWRVYA